MAKCKNEFKQIHKEILNILFKLKWQMKRLISYKELSSKMKLIKNYEIKMDVSQSLLLFMKDRKTIDAISYLSKFRLPPVKDFVITGIDPDSEDIK